MNVVKLIKIAGLYSIFLGACMIMNAMPTFTGLSIINQFGSITSSILALIFLSGGLILSFNSNISLEKIISNTKDIENSRARAVELYTEHYMKALDRERKIPRGLVSHYEKMDYARNELIKGSDPLVVYDSNNSIEFIKNFGNSPARDRVPMIGDEGKVLPKKVNYAITNPILLKLTEKYSNDNQLWAAARSKLYRLTAGQGVDMKYLKGTSVVYLRDISSGARVFLNKKSEDEYDLIGISSGQQLKKDEDKAMSVIRELYKI